MRRHERQQVVQDALREVADAIHLARCRYLLLVLGPLERGHSVELVSCVYTICGTPQVEPTSLERERDRREWNGRRRGDTLTCVTVRSPLFAVEVEQGSLADPNGVFRQNARWLVSMIESGTNYGISN
jgi:hypothetical protein